MVFMSEPLLNHPLEMDLGLVVTPSVFNSPNGKSMKIEESASNAVQKPIAPGKKDIFCVVAVGVR